VLQFRLRTPDTFVLPLTGTGHLLDENGERIGAYPGLRSWMQSADSLWRELGKSALTLLEQIDYMGKLTHQIPVSPIRVAYAASGMHLHAALVTDRRAVIEHGAYWGAVASEDEGHYLVGILNTPTLTELVRPLMSYGKDERHIDKAVWRLPIPAYDATNTLHADIVSAAKSLTAELDGREWRSDYFVTIRQDVRAWMLKDTTGRKLDNLVRELLGEPLLDDDERDAPPVAPTATGLLRLTSGAIGIEPSDVEIDLDLEFDARRRVYLWGYLVSRHGAAPTYRMVGTSEAEFDPEGLATQLADELGAIVRTAEEAGHAVRLYHYGNTELLYLRRLLGNDADVLLNVSTDLLEVVRSNYFSGVGYSLKRLAPVTGFAWRHEGLTGADTLALIKDARSGSEHAWDRLVQYNEDDTRAMHALRAYLRGHSDSPDQG
jgi:hypothetical protein